MSDSVMYRVYIREAAKRVIFLTGTFKGGGGKRLSAKEKRT